MRLVLNVLWLVLAGFWLFLAYVGAALAQAVTIIQLPFAWQSLKLAVYSLWPFGRVVVADPDSGGVNALGNVLWFVFGGFLTVLAHLLTGLLLCLTVIGIPLGIANFKLMGLAFSPFGKRIVDARHVPADARVVAEVR